MYPRLGGIENVEGILLYNPVLVIAVLVVNAGLLWLLARRGHHALSLIPMQLAVSVGAFGGAKLYSMMFRGRIGSFVDGLDGGWRYPGALVGIIAAAWLARRLLPRGLTPGSYLDVLAPCFALGCAIGRIGCLLHGCCYGAISRLPWAIQYPYGSLPWYAHRDSGRLPLGGSGFLSDAVHPFPIYLFLMEVAVGVYLLRLLPRARFEGQVVLQFLAIHGIAKGVMEIFRDPFSWMHVVVLPMGLVAVAVLGWKHRIEHSRLGAAALSTTHE